MPIETHAHPVIAAAQRAVRSLLTAHGNDAVAQHLQISRNTLDAIARGRKLPAPGLMRDLANWRHTGFDYVNPLLTYADQIEREGFPPRD